jgi:glutamate 5-kinase
MKPSTTKANTRRWVIKIGSALLTDQGKGLDHAIIQLWVDQMAALRKAGIDPVLVSSGSIVEGMSRLGIERRPQAVYQLQGLAAIGQMGLIQVYESFFKNHGTHTAQMLMTRDDFTNRARYLNARSTLRCLLGWGAVPVINENDSVATEEIRLGDNDTLAGLVANLVEAELLVVLTDQEGLYTADPRVDEKAAFVPSGKAGDAALMAMAGEGSVYGRGGMRTKLAAAALAGRSGAATRIVSGREPDVLTRLANGESIGTLLVPDRAPLAARKQWLASQLEVRGRLTLDAGASEVLTGSGKSLLAVGVTAASGDFQRGEMVACHDPEDREIARGMVNYSAEETRIIMGHPSEQIAGLLGYVDEPELIHRDNLVII